MSLLSQGLGRFGFGNVVSNIATAPHPADNATIVIVVIGGIIIITITISLLTLITIIRIII